MNSSIQVEVAPHIEWLKEAARYFENRPTNGEDSAHWANVMNAANARKAAAYIATLSITPTQNKQLRDPKENMSAFQVLKDRFMPAPSCGAMKAAERIAALEIEVTQKDREFQLHCDTDLKSTALLEQADRMIVLETALRLIANRSEPNGPGHRMPDRKVLEWVHGKALSALSASPQPAQANGPVAYCKACQAVGASNCGYFDECGEPQCITCHQKLPSKPEASEGK